MSTFIKDYIEREKISRRNFMLATAAGLTSVAMPSAFGGGAAMADALVAHAILLACERQRGKGGRAQVVQGTYGNVEGTGTNQELKIVQPEEVVGGDRNT